MSPAKSVRDIRARGDKKYKQTPIGPYCTEEERRRLRESIPHGVHPRVMAKGHLGTKCNYYVPSSPIIEHYVHPYDLENYATRLICDISVEESPQTRRSYWEERLISTWFHLYGEGWRYWQMIIPWMTRTQIKARAVAVGCEQPWSWMAKCRFLESHGFMWSLDDLNYLIDRYPDRQPNGREQGIYVSDKPFAEIQKVAKALNLPTKEILDKLAEYARVLSMG